MNEKHFSLFRLGVLEYWQLLSTLTHSTLLYTLCFVEAQTDEAHEAVRSYLEA